MDIPVHLTVMAHHGKASTEYQELTQTLSMSEKSAEERCGKK